MITAIRRKMMAKGQQVSSENPGWESVSVDTLTTGVLVASVSNKFTKVIVGNEVNVAVGTRVGGVVGVPVGVIVGVDVGKPPASART
jgi:hypothetical protein